MAGMHASLTWFLGIMESGRSKPRKSAENRHFAKHYKFPIFEWVKNPALPARIKANIVL